MPLFRFVIPERGNLVVGLDDAVEILEKEGVLPAEVTQRLLDTETHDGRGYALSPSAASESSNCLREKAIQKALPTAIDPRAYFSAMEGTIWHSAFHYNIPGYLTDIPIPGSELIEDRSAIVTDFDGVERVEILPGVRTRGTVDRIKEDGTEIADFKTTRFPKTDRNGKPYDYGIKEDWILQLNIYARLAEKTGIARARTLWIWRMYTGSWDHSYTFRRFSIPYLSDSELDEACGYYIRESNKILAELFKIKTEHGNEAAREYIKTIPMDGYIRKMFNNKKCTQYCGVQKLCWDLAGMLDF